MKRFEHAIIVLGGIILAFGMLAFVLHHEAEKVRKEQERRSKMYKFIGDESK